MQEYIDSGTELLLYYAPKAITALLLLIIGLYVIKIVTKSSRKLMQKRGVDITLQKFLGNLISWSLKILLFITVISQLGIATTSFAAVIAAAGLAVGLALQGSLSNFAGGALLMIFKPIKIEDYLGCFVFDGRKVISLTGGKFDWANQSGVSEAPSNASDASVPCVGYDTR